MPIGPVSQHRTPFKTVCEVCLQSARRPRRVFPLPIACVALVLLAVRPIAVAFSSDPIAPPASQPDDHRAGDPVEQPIADALAWLAAHQRKDGIWDRRAFDALCPANDRCSQTALKRLADNADVGVSALAALAFLGAGYTHEQGLYADALTKAFEFILAQQHGDGGFSPEDRMQMFGDAIATLAVAEAYRLTHDRVFLDPLRRAVKHLEHAQQQRGGWDYTADTRTGRNDTSITGWVVMALKSAKAAGVEPRDETVFRIIDQFDWATEPAGRVRHADKGHGVTVDPATGRVDFRYGPAMTAVGLYSRAALGLRLDDAPATQQIALLTKDPPSLERMVHDPTNLHSAYYWYFGTAAMARVGGEAWNQWAAALRRSVMEYQERPVRQDGSRRHLYGSWPAFGKDWGKWGRAGSRIYSTALNTLTLEIYYRHQPAYVASRDLIGPVEIRRRRAALGPGSRPAMLALTRRLHADTAEPLLLDLLRSNDPRLRLRAALGLADIGSPRGKAVLKIQRRTGPADRAGRINRALAGLKRVPREFDCGAVTSVSAAAHMFLFDTAGQPLYYGQRVTILRNGRPIATARVNRRFSAERAAAARTDTDDANVHIGDTVTTRKVDHEPSD
ncbi:MAG: hypothetical protein ACE5F9_14635 [Phycisphaerae bacterium]